MKFNSNRLWYIFFRTWEAGKSKKRVTVFFHALAKIWPSLCYGNQEDENEFYWAYEKFITAVTRE